MTQEQDEHLFPYYRSPQAIREEPFTHKMRGLDEAEVREYLDLLADQVQAFEWERREMAAELDRLREENQQLRSSPRPAAPASPPVPAAGAPSAAASAQAAAVLAQAQEVADQLLREAARQAQQLVGAAQAEGRQVVRHARDRAQGQLTAIFDALDGDFARLGRAIAEAPSRPATQPTAPAPSREVVAGNPVVVRNLRSDPLTSPHW